MKKIMKFIFLPLCALALVGCSGEKELTDKQALDYSKKNFSAEKVLAKYESVTYTREMEPLLEDYKEVKDKEDKTAKNKQVLETVKTVFVGLDDITKTIALDAANLDEFFFGEKFLDEFNKLYSSPEVAPTFEKLSSGGLRCESTYSKPFTEEQLTLLGLNKDVAVGAIAVRSQVVSNKEGCIITTKGSSAITVDVDGDESVDVQYTINVDVAFDWNVKQ